MRRLVPLLLASSLAACAMNATPATPKTVVFFGHGSSAIDAAAASSIAIAARQASAAPGDTVTVAGFAAANGNLDVDAQLAATRAKVVAQTLETDGIDAGRIRVVPRAPSNEDAAVGSRRVEITVGSGS